ncbi:MAG: hypothetical protein LBR45_03320 [Bacteroidales bacterium]|jgi:hypothetical protein|nr:hypothetical protein [Bacteroidales bacterium]
MRNKIISVIIFISVSFGLFGQGAPDWLDRDFRQMQYPSNVYLTGFSEYVVESGKSLQYATDIAKLKAQEEVVKSIRSQIETLTKSSIYASSVHDAYNEVETFSNSSTVRGNAEITGITTESYYHQSLRTVYAFAYVNRYELIGYYKGNLSMYLSQAGNSLNTAEQLEQSGEKSKARKQCEDAYPLFSKIRSAQDLLVAIDNSASENSLKLAETEALLSKAIQMQARLAQGIYVYVESSEDLFGKQVEVVANKVKAELSKTGCSFVDNAEQADFRLSLRVSSRQIGNQGHLLFCSADTKIELYNIRKAKFVYTDEFSEKGSQVSQERAGQIAMTKLAPLIVEKLLPWLKN